MINMSLKDMGLNCETTEGLAEAIAISAMRTKNNKGQYMPFIIPIEVSIQMANQLLEVLEK